jgi:outer membrane protein TolC
MKLGFSVVALAVVGWSAAQTPAKVPQTPDVKVPPPLVLPDLAIGGAKLPVGELSLKSAIDFAIINQPSVLSSRGFLQAAQGRRTLAQTGLNPTVGLNLSFTNSASLGGNFTSVNGGGVGWRSSLGLSANQLLYDFGRTPSLVKAQSEGVRFAEADLARVRQDVAFRVANAYYTVLLAKQLVVIAENNVKNRQSQLGLSQARVAVGLGAPSDMVRAKATLADAVAQLTNAQADELASEVNLLLSMGADPRQKLSIGEAQVDDVDSDPQARMDLALKNRPEIRSARADLNQARYALDVAKKTNVPTLLLVAAYSGRGVGDPFSSRSGSLAVLLNWTFGDGGATRGQTAVALGNFQSAVANLTQSTQLVISDVIQAGLDLSSATLRKQTAEVGVANARELVRISNGRYEGGVGQFLEITDAQSQLVSAERNLAVATIDVFRAKIALQRAMGTILK